MLNENNAAAGQPNSFTRMLEAEAVMATGNGAAAAGPDQDAVIQHLLASDRTGGVRRSGGEMMPEEMAEEEVVAVAADLGVTRGV